jgi:ribonuclease P protein component
LLAGVLAKKHRLTKEKDFENVFKRGRAFSGTFIVVKIKKNESFVSRFGVIVSLKVSKKAVVRNKLRRWLGEIIRINSGSLKAGFDVVVVAKPEIIKAPYQEVKRDLLLALEKGKLIQGNK